MKKSLLALILAFLISVASGIFIASPAQAHHNSGHSLKVVSYSDRYVSFKDNLGNVFTKNPGSYAACCFTTPRFYVPPCYDMNWFTTEGTFYQTRFNATGWTAAPRMTNPQHNNFELIRTC